MIIEIKYGNKRLGNQKAINIGFRPAHGIAFRKTAGNRQTYLIPYIYNIITQRNKIPSIVTCVSTCKSHRLHIVGCCHSFLQSHRKSPTRAHKQQTTKQKPKKIEQSGTESGTDQTHVINMHVHNINSNL